MAVLFLLIGINFRAVRIRYIKGEGVPINCIQRYDPGVKYSRNQDTDIEVDATA
jgi:hypothetical protein